MSETYTIKQIADEIGVNKMKVYRFIQKENIREHHTDARTKHYSEHVRRIVIEAFSSRERYAENVTPEHSENDVVVLLKERVQAQEIELVKKNQQLEKMQTIVDQQQQLALQDKKQLEEYKEEIRHLKLSNESSKTFKTVPSVINRDEEKPSENANEAPKKKRRFLWW